MKIAVLVSGLFTSIDNDIGIIRNNCRQKEKLAGIDFYYATYEQYRTGFFNLFPDEKNVFFFNEPIPQYHPYLDIPKELHLSKKYQDIIDFMKRDKGGKRLDWSKYHCNQHLIHSRLFEKVAEKNKYDVIIRTRFDGYISKNADFIPFIEDSYKNQRCNCFAATKQNNFDQLSEVCMKKHPDHKRWMLDQLIIHPWSVLNPTKVESLYQDKLLHAAETGWFQILSKNNMQHRNHDGWVNHDKRVLREHL